MLLKDFIIELEKEKGKQRDILIKQADNILTANRCRDSYDLVVEEVIKLKAMLEML